MPHNRWSSYFREYMFHNMCWPITASDRILITARAGCWRDWRIPVFTWYHGLERSGADHGWMADCCTKHLRVDPGAGILRWLLWRLYYIDGPSLPNRTLPAGAAFKTWLLDWANYNHGFILRIFWMNLYPTALLARFPFILLKWLKGHLLIMAWWMWSNAFQDAGEIIAADRGWER